jgi:hypothetical protein
VSQTNTELSSLIARLEKATEPSRELDADICDLLYGKSQGKFQSPTLEWARLWNHKPTASIDGALTLLPPGQYWIVGYGKNSEAEPLGGAVIYPPQGSKLAPEAEAEAATPAIALCIAALKARAARSVTP